MKEQKAQRINPTKGPPVKNNADESSRFSHVAGEELRRQRVKRLNRRLKYKY